MNPWAQSTTVEDLLTLLEAECPVGIVTDAISHKEMTADERARLISDLEAISQEARDAIAALKRGDTSMNNQFEQAAQNLHNEIEHQGLSTEVIRQFLNQFAAHVLSNVVPSDLLQSSNMKSIEQIVQEMRDMPKEQQA